MRDPANGAWLIPLSRRFDRDDGSFGGIVVAGISANYLEAFYRTFKIGERGGILLANVDGTVLVRASAVRGECRPRLEQLAAVSRPPAEAADRQHRDQVADRRRGPAEQL